MKRFLLSFVLMASVLSAGAFSYERAREQALFLSDKMAYELNLTERQYDLAYQINLDYFMSVSSQRDLFGAYWQYRDADLRYVLYDWQYTLYRTLDYFYQPLRWVRSSWYFPVYSRYSRTHFFFGRPGIYVTYRGGWRHSHRGVRHVSPYASHRPKSGHGLRDRHYPSVGRSNHHHRSDVHRGNHSNSSHRNDGYRSSNRNDHRKEHSYGRGHNQSSHNQGHHNQGSHNNRGQSSMGSSQSGEHRKAQVGSSGRSNSHSGGHNNSGRSGGRSYRR